MANKIFTVIANQCNRGVPPYDGLLGIMNDATDGTTVEVRHVWLAPQCPIADVAGTPGRTLLARVTAVSGGTEVTGAKLDSNSTALPAGVRVHASPDSVTSPTTFGYRHDTRAFGEVLGNNYCAMNASTFDNPGNVGTGYANLYYRGRDSSVESWTIRENEGIALISDTIGMPMAWSARLQLRNLSTSKSYIYDLDPSLIECPVRPGLAYWAVMNNSGSGVTLEVILLDANEVGYTNVIPEYSLVKVSGCVGVGRRTFTPTARDSNDNCPGTVYGVKGPFYANPKAADEGAPYDIPQYGPQAANGVPIAAQLKYSRYRHSTWEPFYQVTTSPAYRFGDSEKLLFDVPTDILGITLRGGEGLAVVQRSSAILNRSALMPVEASISFVLTTPAAVGGGSSPRFGDMMGGLQ